MGRDLDPPQCRLAARRPASFLADIRKAQRMLGWTPRVTPDEGVERLLHWVREILALFGPRRLAIAPSQVDHTGLAA